jgi:hypothetical protein
MSSRLARILLKLFPRSVRHRCGDELLDLQDELRDNGELGPAQLIADMLAGALAIRFARHRAALLAPAVIVAVGVAVGLARIGSAGTASDARQPHFVARLTAVPATGRTCLVRAGSSCSLTPCSEYIARSAVDGMLADAPKSLARGQDPNARTRCAASPHVRPTSPVFVAG